MVLPIPTPTSSAFKEDAESKGARTSRSLASLISPRTDSRSSKNNHLTNTSKQLLNADQKEPGTGSVSGYVRLQELQHESLRQSRF